MKHVWQNIDGYCGGGIPQFYPKMVARFSSGSHFVEVGSFLGQSTALLVVEVINYKKKIQIDCVDIWRKLPSFNDGQLDKPLFQKLPEDYFPAFKENMKRFDLMKYVIPIRGESGIVSNRYEDNCLDFVFLDGNHSYNFVKNDIKAWLPKVKESGILAGHDYGRPTNGVKKAVDEAFDKVKLISTCWWTVK
jgi:predicted O-methyltransferase YrrM